MMNDILFFLLIFCYISTYFILYKSYKNIDKIIILLVTFVIYEGSIINILGSYLFDRVSFLKESNTINLIYLILIAILNLVLVKYISNKLKNSPTNVYKKDKFLKSKYSYYLASLTILFFLILFFNDGNWITNPRLAYQYGRKGLGFIWSLYITFGGLYIIFDYLKKNNLIRSVVILIFIGYFSGSKGFIVYGAIKLYILHVLINDIKIKTKYFIYLISLVSITIPIILIKSFKINSFDFLVIKNVLSRYFDEIHNSNIIFQEYLMGKLKYTNGEILISSNWKYLPRTIFPDKPLTYGSSRLVSIYFPGVEKFGTPSFGSFTHLFKDFGWFGIIPAVFNLPNIITITSSLLIFDYSKLKIFNSKKLFFLSVIAISPSFGIQMPMLLKLLLIYILYLGTRLRFNYN